MFSYGFATRVIIGAASVIAAATITPNAAQATVAKDLAQLAQHQQLGVASDGSYAEQFGSLENTFCAADIAEVFDSACDDGGRNFFGIPMDDFDVSYVVSTDRLHYLAATLLNDNSVLVISDQVSEPVRCETYNYDCLAQLTDNEELLNSVPVWSAS